MCERGGWVVLLCAREAELIIYLPLDVYDGIRSVLQGFLQRSDPTGGFQEKELIQQLITRMDAVPESLSKVPDTSSRIRYLHVRLNPGKAFLDCMVDQSEPSNPLSPVASTVFISLNFRGKQVRCPT